MPFPHLGWGGAGILGRAGLTAGALQTGSCVGSCHTLARREPRQKSASCAQSAGAWPRGNTKPHVQERGCPLRVGQPLLGERQALSFFSFCYFPSFYLSFPNVKMCATCYRLIKIISSGTSPSYHFRKNITYNNDKSHVKFLGPQNMSISSPSWRRCVKYNSRHPLTGKNSPLF